MEKDDEFLHYFFSQISQLCFDKAKEHVEKEKELCRNSPQSTLRLLFLSQLQQLALAEKSYIDLGFLQNKNKGFLRKDNSLRAAYEVMKTDLKRIEENCKQNVSDRPILNHCQNIIQFCNAKINLIDFYEKAYNSSLSRQLKYSDLLNQMESIIQRFSLGFTDITLTPVKAVFSLECEILEQLLRALGELQRLQFLPSLALIYGAHTRLTAWENKMQNRETWKLGFLKNSPLPALFVWLQKLKGSVLSKFSLYFHDVLAEQTTVNDMRQMCSKLHHDHYHKMVNFVKKSDASAVLVIADGNAIAGDVTYFENFPIIISYSKISSNVDVIVEMLSQCAAELTNLDKTIYKISLQTQCTYILTTIETNIYLVIVLNSKKPEKDAHITNFVTEFCTNLRCLKVFQSLKILSK